MCIFWHDVKIVYDTICTSFLDVDLHVEPQNIVSSVFCFFRSNMKHCHLVMSLIGA